MGYYDETLTATQTIATPDLSLSFLYIDISETGEGEASTDVARLVEALVRASVGGSTYKVYAAK